MTTGFYIEAGRGVVETAVLGTENGRRLVSTASSRGVTCLVYGRLHYTAALMSKAGLDPQRYAYASEAELVLAAFQARGHAILEQLEGDFAVAVIDRPNERILGVRDPMGGYPLYWTETTDTIGIATAMRPLDDLKGGATPCAGFLGEVQMLPFFEIDHVPETALDGIHRVLPGSIIEVDTRRAYAGRATIAQRRYWDWSEQQAQPGEIGLDAAAERFRGLLEDAIATRLKGVVAAHLSGGMDSTAIALIGHRRLAEEKRPLHAITLTYDTLHGLSGEKRYIDAVAARPYLETHRIAGDDILDFDHFAKPLAYDEPYPGLFRAAMNRALVERTVATGADVVLTGMGADELTANAPFQIADALRRGRPFEAWREAARWAKAGSRSTLSILAPFGLEPLVPTALRAGLPAALNGGYALSGRGNAWAIPAWVNRSFAGSGRLRDRVRSHLAGLSASQDSVLMSFAHELLRMTAGDWVRTNLAAPHGLHITHPFRDPRLIGFALGARAAVPAVPGEQKALLSRAVADTLPEAIRTRREKGHFNAVYFKGLQRNLPALEQLIDDTEALAAPYFDARLLRDRLHDVALGVDDVRRVHGMNNSLAILHWLRQLPEWRRANVVRTPVPSSETENGQS